MKRLVQFCLVLLAAPAVGATGLLVTFTLNTAPPPPTPVAISSISIGSTAGTVSPHTNQYTLSALFNFPGNETPGSKDVAITFPGSFVGCKAAGFTVTAATDVAADFFATPTNGTPPPRRSTSICRPVPKMQSSYCLD
jgi:hypothetical protein